MGVTDSLGQGYPRYPTFLGFGAIRNIGDACSPMERNSDFFGYFGYLYSIGTLAYHRMHLKVSFWVDTRGYPWIPLLVNVQFWLSIKGGHFNRN